MSLSRQSIALVLRTKNEETNHIIHLNTKQKQEKLLQLTKALSWFGVPFMTSNQETAGRIVIAPQSDSLLVFIIFRFSFANYFLVLASFQFYQTC